jgi:thioredoxin reductase
VTGMSKHEVIIVGAGLAGLGAARTLLSAGISDVVILEGNFFILLINIKEKIIITTIVQFFQLES